MADRVHPSYKPTINGTTNSGNGVDMAKPPLCSQQRIQRRPLNHRRSRRNMCCYYCFWTILVLLVLSFLAAITGAALYELYRPHRPQFSILSLRIARFNLTASPDTSSFSLSSLLNLTLATFNPNSHLTFFYDPLTLSCLSNSGIVANGTVAAFTSETKNETVLRAVMGGSINLDSSPANSLRSDLRKKGGVPLRIKMETKVKVKIWGLKTKKVAMRVSCDGIKSAAPKGKSPTVASVSYSDCKVDWMIKIWNWKWTF